MNAVRGLLTGALLVSCGVASLAGQDSGAELQRKADQASGRDCTRLSMQAARQASEDAKRAFASGEVKAGRSSIDVSLNYVRRAVDCSLQAHTGEKATEIDLRRLIGRMNEILHRLDTEDRPQLAQSLTELEAQRDRLLQALFGAAAGGRNKKP
jgi:hypothetical protein